MCRPFFINFSLILDKSGCISEVVRVSVMPGSIMITCIMSYHIIKLYRKYYFVQKLCALVVLAVAQLIKFLILDYCHGRVLYLLQ